MNTTTVREEAAITGRGVETEGRPEAEGVLTRLGSLCGTAAPGCALAGFWVVRLLLRGLLRLLFRIEVRELERVPREGCIVVANHLSWLDGFLLLAFLPFRPDLYVLADRTAIHSVWWKRWVVASVGRVITIDRTGTHGDGGALRKAYRLLAEGKSLALFPEGRVGHGEGELGQLQKGAGALCLRSGRPVLPVALSGVGELYHRKRIRVTMGVPFQPAAVEGSARERMETVTRHVQGALEAALQPYRDDNRGPKRMRWLTDMLS